MRTPCCQSLRSNRLVVSEYEVPKVWFTQEWETFFETPCSTEPYGYLFNSLYLYICSHHISEIPYTPELGKNLSFIIGKTFPELEKQTYSKTTILQVPGVSENYSPTLLLVLFPIQDIPKRSVLVAYLIRLNNHT